MKAQVGDHIILAASHVDAPTRAGEVLEVRDPGGGPPYVVRWDDGHTGWIYPGPGSVLRIGHAADPGMPSADEASATDTLGRTSPPTVAAHDPAVGHVREWTVRVAIFESGDDTSATAVLLSDAPTHLSGRGASHRAPSDAPVPEIADEVAVARALRHLADRLLGGAEADIAAATGMPAHLRPD